MSCATDHVASVCLGRLLRHLALVLALSLAGRAGALSLAPGEHEDVVFGHRIPDPFRQLEQVQSPPVAAWMKSQAARTREILDSIPTRAALMRSLEAIDAATPARVTGITRSGDGQWFYLKRRPGEEQFSLWVRRGLQGAERRLVDPQANASAGAEPVAINWFVPSPDGRYLAYGLSAGGSEDAVLHLIDTRTGRAIGRPLDRARFAGVSWDGSEALYFNRLAAVRPGADPTERLQRSKVHRLVPGSPPEPTSVLGTGVPGTSIAPAEMPFVSITHDGRWALGWVVNGVQREIRLYVTSAASLRRGRPNWRSLIEHRDQVTRAEYHDDTLYLLTHRDAPRFKLIALDIRATSVSQAREVVPASDQVLTGLGAASDGLYLEMREGNHKKLVRLSYQGGKPEPVKLPLEGAFSLSSDDGSATDPRLPGAVIELQGWTQARQIYQVNADLSVRHLDLQPRGPYDSLEGVIVTEVLVPSHDGAQVPMSIIHHRDAPRDGNRPTLLYGYAAYGDTEEPWYSVFRIAWLRAGGVHVIANPRGSGVFGEPWHKAGFQQSKPNSWKDFIACAEYLVRAGYTRPQRLGILGGSAGGILVGRAMTERPDLFAAVVSQVGALDMIRAEDTPNGVPNIPEFGSRRTEQGLLALLAMSTYHQIRDGVAYPAVLLTHGVNDSRVEVWQSTKTAARLQAASSSGKPVLLRLDYEAGHGIGNTKRQIDEERADVISFLLWQLGEPGWAPSR